MPHDYGAAMPEAYMVPEAYMFSPPIPGAYMAHMHLHTFMQHYSQLVETNHALYHNNTWSMEELRNRVSEVHQLRVALDATKKQSGEELEKQTNEVLELRQVCSSLQDKLAHMMATVVVEDLVNRVVLDMAIKTRPPDMKLENKIRHRDAGGVRQNHGDKTGQGERSRISR